MIRGDVNTAVWRAATHVSEYDSRVLEPVEIMLLARYREKFAGRVLDVGCGAGRVLGYLLSLGADAVAIDIAPAMVERCRQRFPGADVRVGDMEKLADTVDGPFDVVLMSDNVLDVLDDSRRRAVLGGLAGLLAPGGLVVFSSHNLDDWERTAPPESGQVASGRLREVGARLRQLANRSPVWMVDAVVRLPRRRSNRRRLGPLQHRAADHAIINDEAHDYSLLHYYISRADQELQLDRLGYVLVDVLALDGNPVGPGAEGRGPSLYYVASAR